MTGLPQAIVLRYEYEFLPKGTISRLTVRQHRFVRDPEMAWVTGVLFEKDDTSALVEVLPGGNEIELRVRGPENKALLSVISANLDALNGSIRGLREKVHKRIPCSCKRCRTAMTPWFFDNGDLVRRKESGKLQIECSLSFENVDVLRLLDSIEVKESPAWANDLPKMRKTREFRIFLASSEELRWDRDEFHRYLGKLNDELLEQGIYLKLVRWEHFLDAMSETCLQDEYNREVRSCSVFVSLFFTKVGQFTREEFGVARKQFIETGRPLIYTYFKNAPINTGDWSSEDYDSLNKFKNELKALGHFPIYYTSIEDLKLRFREQLSMIQEKWRI